jgi:Uma2 family endonuclease
MSVEEFLSNPDIHFYDLHELHDGEVVVVPPPSGEHVDLQKRLESLLRPILGTEYTVHREFYITLAAESRRVDVAAVSTDRWKQQSKSVFHGAPELMIEVLSPSNIHLDVDKLRYSCLQRDTRQFWVVNMDLRTVTVYKRDLEIAMYDLRRSDIPLDELRSGAALTVAAIFE